MSTNKTQHYHLNQWEAEDKVLRAEFNQDNAKLDSALPGRPGAGGASLRHPQNCHRDLSGEWSRQPDHPPGLCSQGGPDHDQSGLMYSPNSLRLYVRRSGPPGHSASHRYRRSISSPYEYYPGVEVTDTGFTVYETRIGEYAGVSCNSADTTYHYLAIGE